MFRKLDIDKNTGRLYALGYTYGNYQGTNADNTLGSGDILVQKFDLNLNKLEARQFGTPYEDRGLCALHDNTLYVGGMTEGAMVGQNKGSFDAFVVALKTSDLSIVKGSSTATDEGVTVPFEVRLYPNPVSTNLTIEKSEFSTLKYRIYNPLGQVVLQGPINAPIQTIDVSTLEKGLYFMRFTDGQTVTVEKFLKK